MLTTDDQKKRITSLLNCFPIQWNENKALRYRLPVPKSNKASLWVRLTTGSESFAITTTGEVTDRISGYIQKLVGVHHKAAGTHRDWLDVSYEHVHKILSQFSKCYASNHLDYKTKNILDDIKKIEGLEDVSDTEKNSLIQSRIGQGRFRDGLIKLWGGCSVTSYNGMALLVASHIKPWSISNNAERLDPFNGFLLLPNLDKVFDLGYISFSHSGNIIISSELCNYEQLGIFSAMRILVKKNNEKYLEYHREHIFKNT